MEHDHVEKLTLTIEQASRAIGVSRATGYKLANSGELPVIRLGEKRMVVPIAALNIMLLNINKPKESSDT